MEGGSATTGDREEGDAGATGRYGETLRAALAGVGGFLAGYGVFLLLQGSKIQQTFARQTVDPTYLQEAGVTPPSTWELSGLFYYAVHKASLEVGVSEGFGGQSIDPAFFQPLGENPFRYPWFVPVVALLVAGALAVRLAAPRNSTRAAEVGGKVVAGYLPAVLAGMALFAWSATFPNTGRTLSFAPKPLSTVLFAGVLYPVVFGSVGGFLGYGALTRLGWGPDSTANASSGLDGSDPETPDESVSSSVISGDAGPGPSPSSGDVPDAPGENHEGSTPRYARSGESDEGSPDQDDASTGSREG